MTTLSYNSLTEVPDGLRDSAVEGEDGVFTIKVAPAQKITEFRENNVKLSKERDELTAVLTRYEQATGIGMKEAETLDDYVKRVRELEDTKRLVEDGKLVENTSVDEAAQARVSEVTKNFQTQLQQMAQERDVHKDRAKQAELRLNGAIIENQMRFVAADPDVAMNEGAVSLLLNEAQTLFRVEEGKLVPKAADGTVVYGSDGVNPMTLKEWATKQREERPFLFKGTQGGGASGADNKTTGRLTNAELAAMTPAQRMNWSRANPLRT